MNRILIATDGAPAARTAVGVGVELAASEGAQVSFAHVEPAVRDAPFPIAPPLRDTSTSGGWGRWGKRQMCGGTPRPGRGRLLCGGTVDEIVAYADSLDVDLIVIGSGTHGGSPGANLGRASQGILHEARRPVLVVPTT